MSIDARISAVTVVAPSHCKTCGGTGKDPESDLDLCPDCHGATANNPAARLAVLQRLRAREAQVPTLDPDILAGMIGTEIWGGASDIMVCDRKWADWIHKNQAGNLTRGKRRRMNKDSMRFCIEWFATGVACCLAALAAMASFFFVTAVLVRIAGGIVLWVFEWMPL